jgi:hypothetical protein
MNGEQIVTIIILALLIEALFGPIASIIEAWRIKK